MNIGEPIPATVCVRRAMRHERKLRLKIAKAHAQGSQKQAAHLTRVYLQSFDARYIATLIAYRKLKSHRRPPKALLPEIAASLDPWRGSSEEVVVNFKPKASNEHDFRPIMDFGIENRALQHLVWGALKAQADLHHNQFYTRGGGPAAVHTVMEALAAGHNWVIETDIVNFYPSFDGDRLPGLLPLPKEVTTNVIIASHLNLVPGNILKCFGPDDGSEQTEGVDGPLADALAEARRGIPQGSAVSPLVTEVLLAPVISQLPDSGRAMAYADNIQVMAREENDAVSMTKALWSALEAHPAGPLWPKLVRYSKPNEGFEFLGCAFKVKNGCYTVAPSPKNLAKFGHALHCGLKQVEDPSQSAKMRRNQASQLRRYVRSWTSAFSMWDEAKEFREKKLALIDETANRADA